MVEILVAVTVLAVIILLVAQLTNGATNTTGASQRRVEADAHARMIFDRIANDIRGMPKGKELDYFFWKNAGNDVMFFYSDAPGYFTGSSKNKDGIRSPMTLVGYRIPNRGTPVASHPNGALERAGRALTWDGRDDTGSGSGGNSEYKVGAVQYLTYAVAGGTPAPKSTIYGDSKNSGYYQTLVGKGATRDDGDTNRCQTLSDNTFRMELCFQLIDGTYSGKPLLSVQPADWPTSLGFTFYTESPSPPTVSDDESKKFALGSRWWDRTNQRAYICTRANKDAAIWAPTGTDDINAIVVTLAVLNAKSRVLAPNLQSAAKALSDGDTPEVAAVWNDLIVDPGFPAKTGLPLIATQQIRVYQRTIGLK